MRLVCLFAAIVSPASAGFTCESSESSENYFSQCTAWVDGNGRFSTFQPVNTFLADVQDVYASDEATYLVDTNCLPSYNYTVSHADVDALNTRPKADTDFENEKTTLSVGDVVKFGDDIGYVGTQGCASEGYGFWPHGPACPVAASGSFRFPIHPTNL